ncbi:alpha-L-fucosidase-like, partial [Oppia nitens]|uniref:alpha-L-fucosidase-like n=1 Tax=Oppia nitens TaxID=1686743 RepID=UPI0023D9DBB9
MITYINNLFLCLILGAFVGTYRLTSASATNKTVQRYTPDWKSLDSRPLPVWYDDVKIGIFLHWGVFSVPSFGTEWFWHRWQADKKKDFVDFMARNYRPDWTYADFASQFTAEFYDPKHWAEVFKASGAKYVVLTTKHHEGYTMWPSKVSFNWNAMDVGPKRDLVGDLATAVRDAGLHFGVYHSLYEWFNPLFLADKDKNFTTNLFTKHKTRPELEELVNTYKPDLIWSDGSGGAPHKYWEAEEFMAWLYNDSPVKDKVVINDRWGAGTGGKHGSYFNYHDRYNPGVLQKHKWENAMTIDKHSWGYRRNAKSEDYLSTHELLTTLAQTISCGGNLLVNVGPSHDGLIKPIFEERLRDLGHWLSINGEAVYSSKPWTHQNDTKTPDVWYTMQEKTTVYSIVLNWPKNNELELGSVDHKTVKSVDLLGEKGNLTFKTGSGGHTVVTFPHISPDSPVKWAFV